MNTFHPKLLTSGTKKKKKKNFLTSYNLNIAPVNENSSTRLKQFACHFYLIGVNYYSFGMAGIYLLVKSKILLKNYCIYLAASKITQNMCISHLYSGLTLKAPNKNCSRRQLIFHFYLLKKIWLDFSYESSA